MKFFYLSLVFFSLVIVSSCIEESGKVDYWYYVNQTDYPVKLKIYQTSPIFRELRVESLNPWDTISHSIPLTEDFDIFQEPEVDSVSIIFDETVYLSYPCRGDSCNPNRDIRLATSFSYINHEEFYFITQNDYETAIPITN